MTSRYISTLFLLAALFLFQNTPFAQTFAGQIGTGVGFHQWNRPFVDIMKNSRGFEAVSGPTVAMDGLGWPIKDCKLVLLEAWPVAEWLGQDQIDDPEKYHIDLSGSYHCSFTGRATVTKDFGDFELVNFAYDLDSNLTTFQIEIPLNANGVVILKFLDTVSEPGFPLHSGFTNFKCVRPGYDLHTSQVFTDEFLEGLDAACFSVFRMMNPLASNNNNPDYPATIGWGDRKVPASATYNATNDHTPAGVPWETLIQLANITDKDIWINVPVAATDDYVTKLATLFKNNLEPGIDLYVEYSNEVWNWGFWQAGWNDASAQANGLTYIENYAKRTAEIAQIFGNVFGAGSLNNRVKVINAWQIGWWPPDAQMRDQLEYIQANFGEPKNLIYALGVAPYFNCGNACTTGAVPEILAAMTASSDASVESRQLVADLAEEWELPGGMVAYEGGSDTGGGDTTNVANRILAERSPEMGDLFIHDLKDNWFPHGGGLFVYLELAGGYNRYGSWGLTDDITKPDRNHKMQAVRTLLGIENCVTGVEDAAPGLLSHLEISPNPTSGAVNLSFVLEQTSEVKAEVSDMLGRRVFEKNFGKMALGPQQLSFLLENIKAGVYVLTLSGTHGHTTGKLVVQNR